MINTHAKRNLTDRDYNIVTNELEQKGKKPLIAYLLWFFAGGIGGHRFYLGDTGYAVAMLLLNWATLGIWSLIDLFLINKRIETKNQEIEAKIINDLNVTRGYR